MVNKGIKIGALIRVLFYRYKSVTVITRESVNESWFRNAS